MKHYRIIHNNPEITPPNTGKKNAVTRRRPPSVGVPGYLIIDCWQKVWKKKRFIVIDIEQKADRDTEPRSSGITRISSLIKAAALRRPICKK